jgi:hypothetical protein
MASKEVTNAAKAIYESRNGAGCRPWSQMSAIAKAAYLDDAEAARKSFLAALQEPTEATLDAYWVQSGESKEMRSRVHSRADRYWRSMLNASPLGEQSE